MQIEINAPQFEKVLDNNEKVLWIGHPKLIPFLSSGVGFLIFGTLWFCFDYFVFIRNIELTDATGSGFILGFFGLHLLPFWLSVANMLRLCLVYKNTFYTYTNRRLMARTGFLGTDFKSFDFDKISDLEVNVNPLENMFNVGTIRIYSGRLNEKGGRVSDNFVAISNPYEVFKMIKQISVDIKTDYNYPNALRPKENPGYVTDYNPDKK